MVSRIYLVRRQGKEQIFLEIGERDDQLLLTLDIYDSAANYIAKLRRNAWVFNNRDRFEVNTSPASLKLIDKESGDVVVEANVVGKDRIRILQGKLYTHRGHLLEITPQYWRITGGITMSGNVIDSCGGAVAIEWLPSSPNKSYPALCAWYSSQIQPYDWTSHMLGMLDETATGEEIYEFNYK